MLTDLNKHKTKMTCDKCKQRSLMLRRGPDFREDIELAKECGWRSKPTGPSIFSHWCPTCVKIYAANDGVHRRGNIRAR